jgi:type III secretion protein J
VLLGLLCACGREELLHGLDEAQANDALVALDEGGVRGEKRPGDGGDEGWTLSVGARDAPAGRRILAAQGIPHPRAPGLGEVFGEAGMVPTPTEEHARYLHALSGELARSLEALDGVIEARVHLGLPQEDPMRPGERRLPRAAVLLRCRPAACARVRSLEPGLRSLVAGAADGLAPDAVALLVAEATVPRGEDPPARAPSRWRLAAAASLLLAASALGAAALHRRLGRPLRGTAP